MGEITDRHLGMHKKETLIYMAIVAGLAFILGMDFIYFKLTDHVSSTTLIYTLFYLIFDLCVRAVGLRPARMVCIVGFLAILITYFYGVPAASLVAFLLSMMLNIQIFYALSQKGGSWIIAPFVSSVVAGFLDSFLFIYIKEYGTPNSTGLLEVALHNFGAKVIIILLSMVAYKMLMDKVIIKTTAE